MQELELRRAFYSLVTANPSTSGKWKQNNEKYFDVFCFGNSCHLKFVDTNTRTRSKSTAEDISRTLMTFVKLMNASTRFQNWHLTFEVNLPVSLTLSKSWLRLNNTLYKNELEIRVEVLVASSMRDDNSLLETLHSLDAKYIIERDFSALAVVPPGFQIYSTVITVRSASLGKITYGDLLEIVRGHDGDFVEVSLKMAQHNTVVRIFTSTATQETRVKMEGFKLYDIRPKRSLHETQELDKKFPVQTPDAILKVKLKDLPSTSFVVYGCIDDAFFSEPLM